MDLTPREPTPPRRTRRWGSVSLLAAVVIGAGFLVFQFLNNATVYFCNADEVGVRSNCTGDKRFRLQGDVVDGSVVESAGGVDFDLTYNGVTIPVEFTDTPPELFQPGIPVVVEGVMDGEVFVGDRILVKHSEEYVEENPDRVDPSVESTPSVENTVP